MKITRDLLFVAETNARPLGPGDVSDLVASLRAHGQLVPLLVVKQEDGSYSVLDGQRRLAAMAEAGINEVQCILYEGEREAEAGAAVNIVREGLSARDIALTAGRVLTSLGFRLDEVGTMAAIKKGADKLRKTAAIIEAASGCAIPIDQFLTYGALSVLEPEWWDYLKAERVDIGTMALALSFSPEERQAIIEKTGPNGWIERRNMWAMRENGGSQLRKENALFSKMSGIEEGSDLFGADGYIASGSVKTFLERQQAAARDVITSIEEWFDIKVGLRIGTHSFSSGNETLRLTKANVKTKEDLEAALFPSWRSDRDNWTLKEAVLQPEDGCVYIVMRQSRGSVSPAGDEAARGPTKKLLEQLDAWLVARLTKAILEKPDPFLRMVSLCVQNWNAASVSGETFTLPSGYEYPFAKIGKRSVGEIVKAANNQLRAIVALSMLQRLRVRATKAGEWTMGTRWLLAAYGIDPRQDLGDIVSFLSQMPGVWLEARCKERELAASSRGKMASALAGKLGEDWWPSWLNGFLPVSLDPDTLVYQEEDDEAVHPAARPDVHATHAGDPPRGSAGEDDDAGHDEGDDFDAPPRR